ncbi:integrase [Photorhabdus luminescens subsp. sonorensis]|uniref:Integrase n=1 Tax=Photorhabdus luminescens subsp. sonorensis TaxID=1173677 RepID=A0A5C4RI92_PHOLU|nr:integrase [Photorhabdus luminescens subsp. sonorensis]
MKLYFMKRKFKLVEWEAFYNNYKPHGGLKSKMPYEALIEKIRV